MDSLNPQVSLGLGCSLFARRYLGNRFFFLFLQVLRCFSSLRLPSNNYLFIIRYIVSHYVGSPIRKSTDLWLFASTRSLSQLITSFISSWCQVILCALLVAWPIISLLFPALKLLIIANNLTCYLFFAFIWLSICNFQRSFIILYVYTTSNPK